MAHVLSRHRYLNHEWELHDPTPHSLCYAWDTPCRDLLAMCEAHKFLLYCSWGATEPSSQSGALLPWGGKLHYASRPISLLPKVLQKICQDTSHNTADHSILARSVVVSQPPLAFCLILDLTPDQGTVRHLNPGPLTLMAWFLDGACAWLTPGWHQCVTSLPTAGGPPPECAI